MILSELRTEILNGGWTLFLDRDGVVNVRKYGGYVETVDQFHFLPGAAEAIARFRPHVLRTIVVTNQRGIAIGKMTEEDLEKVHGHFRAGVEEAGGKLDAIFHCPHDRNEGCPCRKPATGMPLEAQASFPEIDFQKSILFGDSPSDLQMGRALGMTCVHVGPDEMPEALVDLHLDALADFWAADAL